MFYKICKLFRVNELQSVIIHINDTFKNNKRCIPSAIILFLLRHAYSLGLMSLYEIYNHGKFTKLTISLKLLKDFSLSQ